MSKRGRGGAGIGSRMSGQALPFEIDPDLVEAADQSFEESQQKHDSAKEIFPDYGPVILAAPITDFERRQIQILRELDAKRRAGPFWTGTKDDWARIEAVSGRNAVYDPFECAQKKSSKRAFRLADLTKVKLEPRFFPKELHKTIGHTGHTDDSEEPAVKRQKRLGLANKSVLDRLARFDKEDDEDAVNGETNDENESTSGGNEEEGEDFEAEPEDDVFDEDDDDANNDYNAEAYFDGGEDDFDEGGGGEGGDDVF